MNTKEILRQLEESIEKGIQEVRRLKTQLAKEKEQSIDWEAIPKPVQVLCRDNDSQDFDEVILAKYEKDSVYPFKINKVEHEGWKQCKLDPDAKNIYAWKPWNGGNCPTRNPVVLKLRNGEQVFFEHPSHARWDDTDDDGDIIFYAELAKLI